MVTAPQAGWWLLSDERHTLTATQVEEAVSQEFEVANELRLDRLECEPIRRPPGTSLCHAQEADKIFGLLYEVDENGDSDLFTVKAGELAERAAG